MLMITTYTSEKHVEVLPKTLEKGNSILLNWFQTIEIKSNNDKCHLIVANREGDSITLSDEIQWSC